MKLSDLYDKWVILLMKARFDKELCTEEAEFRKEVVASLRDEPFEEKVVLLLTLMEANAKVWENEAAIRREYDEDAAANGSLDMAEIGRRAIVIRDYNKTRIAAKMRLDEIEGRKPEGKFDHASV